MHGPIHVFRAGGQDLFGVTRDASGANLPRETGDAWNFIRTVDYESSTSPWGVEAEWKDKIAAMEAGLALNGFFLSEAAALPPHMVGP